jgi:hypothetical protein
MTATAATVRGYNDAGHTVEITQKITETQFRAIERILGRPPERFKDWAEKFAFDPPTNAHGARLRSYLRSHGIAHDYEKRFTWVAACSAGAA